MLRSNHHARRHVLVAASFVLAMAAARMAHADDSQPPSGPPPSQPYGLETNRTSMTAERQEEDGLHFGPGIRYGGYAAPELKVTSFAGEVGLLAGAQAGWIVDRHVIIGAAGYALVSNVPADPSLSRGDAFNRIGFGYGGARLLYVVSPQRIVHMNVGLLVGAGGVTVTSRNANSNNAFDHDGSAIFVVEPQTELEINVMRHLRIAANVSYRFVGDTDKPGMASSDLSGVAAGLALKLGSF